MQHEDQRPRRGFREAEPGEHLGRGQPAIVLDGFLRDIGEHRISAAEGDDRHLGEEPGDVAPDRHVHQQHDRPEPDGEDDEPGAPRRRRHACDAVGVPRHGGVEQRGRAGLRRGVPARGEGARRGIADGERGQHDDGEGQVEGGERDEGRRRQRPGSGAVQGAFRDPQQRLQHQHQHGAFQPEEQRRDDRDLAERRVDDGQRQHHRGPR